MRLLALAARYQELRDTDLPHPAARVKPQVFLDIPETRDIRPDLIANPSRQYGAQTRPSTVYMY